MGKSDLAEVKESTKDDFRRDYFLVIDRLCCEFESRFMNALPLLESISALDIDLPHFLNTSRLASVAAHYKVSYIDTILFVLQTDPVRRYIDSLGSRPKDPFQLHDCVKVTLKAYSEVLKIIQNFITLSISMASNERFFSTISLTKTYLRSLMGYEKLSDLMLIFSEKTPWEIFGFRGYVGILGKMRPSRFTSCNKTVNFFPA